MFFEEEVYGMLNWGFGAVMVIQFILFVGLWQKYKFDSRSFIYIITYLILFTFAGYNLLVSLNTFESQDNFGSEEASLKIGIAGIFWAISVLFLFLSVFRLVRATKKIRS